MLIICILENDATWATDYGWILPSTRTYWDLRTSFVWYLKMPYAMYVTLLSMQ